MQKAALVCICLSFLLAGCVLQSRAPVFSESDAGTLPEAPDMRPSVTNATWKPLLCNDAKEGVSLCNSGMPLARGP